MRILLLGKDGQLGRELQRSLAQLGTLTAWGRETADFSKPESLFDLVIAAQPDVIVNAAAYTAVDKAESEPEVAHAINAAAPAALAKAALALGCQLIHYSTDYVFDGLGTAPWTEDDTPNPQNVYGASKLAGEQAIAASGCKHLIFRTSWVYAKGGGNFAKTMLRLALERDSLSVIDDQIGAPTDAGWLADMTARIVQGTDLVCPYTVGEMSQSDKGVVSEQKQEEPPCHFVTSPLLRSGGTNANHTNGIYHAANAGEVSWHGYASYLIAKARQIGFPIRVAQDAIQAVPSSAFPTPARRPLNSRLDCSKLAATFGITPPPWQQGIDQLLQHLKP
jgi:dTDP-4-dehydrorhamnose reductase